jgi:UV DNA damage endonuclease
MNLGLCCISIELKEQGYSFQTMTYKRFSSLPREEALSVLCDRIINNLEVTEESIKYCAANEYCYRLSSDIFPLMTYEKANIEWEELPRYDEIEALFDKLYYTVTESNVRVSCHPSEFNVLASLDEDAVTRTVTELNFYSSFLDRIGCPADHNSPMNIHINNKQGTNEEIVDRFYNNFMRLDPCCRDRITVENDDKLKCWSVKQLIEDFYPKTQIPITFDYLHHACHPNGWTEQQAIRFCRLTWQGYRPLFHYSESIPDYPNPRKHADYATRRFNTYGLDFDVDMELKMKDRAIARYNQEVLV